MCSSLLGLGGTYVQQCFVCLSPYIYVPHFPVYSKAIQHVFTLLHVLSTPRGPPARKSSHCPTRFAFPCTVDDDDDDDDDVVVHLFRLHHHFS